MVEKSRQNSNDIIELMRCNKIPLIIVNYCREIQFY